MNEFHPLREAAEAATAGPWVTGYRFGVEALVQTPGEYPIAITDMFPRAAGVQIEQEANARFIALANPSKVIALLDENAGLRAALEEIVTNCSMTREQFVGQGPAFACRQVERAVEIARQALGSGK